MPLGGAPSAAKLRRRAHPCAPVAIGETVRTGGVIVGSAGG